MNKNIKKLSRSEKVVYYCKILGIETFKDLQDFKRENREDGETLLQTFERYIMDWYEE